MSQLTEESDRPRDPRRRAVTAHTACGRGALALRLECGHVVKRRPMICTPSHLICSEC